jgi:hypothetical protein
LPPVVEPPVLLPVVEPPVLPPMVLPPVVPPVVPPPIVFVTHRWLATSHTWPFAQSAELEQPSSPATHAPEVQVSPVAQSELVAQVDTFFGGVVGLEQATAPRTDASSAAFANDCRSMGASEGGFEIAAHESSFHASLETGS